MRVKILKPIDPFSSVMRKPFLPFYVLIVLAMTTTLVHGQTTTPPVAAPAQMAAPTPPPASAPTQTPAAQPGAGAQPGASTAPGQGVEAPTIKVQANEVDLV